MRLGVMCSGEGTNFQNLITYPQMRHEIVLMIHNTKKCGAVKRAAKYGIPHCRVAHKDGDRSNNTLENIHWQANKPDKKVAMNFVLQEELVDKILQVDIAAQKKGLKVSDSYSFTTQMVENAIEDYIKPENEERHNLTIEKGGTSYESVIEAYRKSYFNIGMETYTIHDKKRNFNDYMGILEHISEKTLLSC